MQTDTLSLVQTLQDENWSIFAYCFEHRRRSTSVPLKYSIRRFFFCIHWACDVCVCRKVCWDKNLSLSQPVLSVSDPWFHYWNVWKRWNSPFTFLSALGIWRNGGRRSLQKRNGNDVNRRDSGDGTGDIETAWVCGASCIMWDWLCVCFFQTPLWKVPTNPCF